MKKKDDIEKKIASNTYLYHSHENKSKESSNASEDAEALYKKRTLLKESIAQNKESLLLRKKTTTLSKSIGKSEDKEGGHEAWEKKLSDDIAFQEQELEKITSRISEIERLYEKHNPKTDDDGFTDPYYKEHKRDYVSKSSASSSMSKNIPGLGGHKKK
jgi:DNA repair ATPase RecN